jgi:hypothetical protein
MKYIDRVTGIKRRTQNRAIILSSLGHFSVSPTRGVASSCQNAIGSQKVCALRRS